MLSLLPARESRPPPPGGTAPYIKHQVPSRLAISRHCSRNSALAFPPHFCASLKGIISSPFPPSLSLHLPPPPFFSSLCIGSKALEGLSSFFPIPFLPPTLELGTVQPNRSWQVVGDPTTLSPRAFLCLFSACRQWLGQPVPASSQTCSLHLASGMPFPLAISSSSPNI